MVPLQRRAIPLDHQIHPSVTSPQGVKECHPFSPEGIRSFLTFRVQYRFVYPRLSQMVSLSTHQKSEADNPAHPRSI